MAIICIISLNSVAFVANYVKMVDWPDENVLKYTETKYDGRAVLFAVAELFIIFVLQVLIA